MLNQRERERERDAKETVICLPSEKVALIIVVNGVIILGSE